MVHHIYLQGIVGEAITKKAVVSAVSGIKPEDTLLVHIHSNGGDVEEGWSIHDYLVSESSRIGFQIDTIVEGVCKSIATLFFALGKNRTITPNSRLLIHNPWGENVGDAASMIRYAEALAIEENRLAEFYARSIGANVNEVKKWMAVETEYNAQQAVSMGFATGVALGETTYADSKAVALIKNFKSNNKQTMSKPTFNAQGFIAKAKRALKALAGEIKAFDATLEDGTAIMIESEGDVPQVGDLVLDSTGAPVADGSYTLADGTSMEVVGGLITVLTPAKPAASALSADEIVALQARVAELETENASLTQALEVAEPILASVQALKATTGAFAPKAQTQPRPIGQKPTAKKTEGIDFKALKPNQRRAAK